MANTTTRPGTNRAPLISYLKEQKNLDAQVRSVLNSSYTRISAELRRLEASSGIGDKVRRDQLSLAQRAIHEQNALMFQRVGDSVAAAKERAAAAAVESMFPLTALSSVMLPEQTEMLLRSAKAGAVRNLQHAESRLTLSKIPLSQNVWENTAKANKKVDELINTALTRGASARELAKDVRAYVNPNTPGGVRYASERLARTELNNAFHATQVQESIKSPFVTLVKWNLSGSHPRPDECNEYADSVHFEGGEAGQYKPEEVPAKPHPNCLCFCTPEVDSTDEFLKKFQAGEYDDYLEEMGAPPGGHREVVK